MGKSIFQLLNKSFSPRVNNRGRMRRNLRKKRWNKSLSKQETWVRFIIGSQQWQKIESKEGFLCDIEDFHSSFLVSHPLSLSILVALQWCVVLCCVFVGCYKKNETQKHDLSSIFLITFILTLNKVKEKVSHLTKELNYFLSLLFNNIIHSTSITHLSLLL
jgi:hypothetical protein